MNNSAFASRQFDLIAYEVQPGDNLYRIVSRYYGPQSPQKIRGAIDQIVEANRYIRNPNLIRPGQIIKLSVPRQYCVAPKGFQHNVDLFDGMAHTPWFDVLSDDWSRATPEERSFMRTVSPLMIGSGTSVAHGLNVTFRTNAPLVGEVASLYESYQAGDISKGQYDYQRRNTLTRLSNNLGPTQRLLYGNRAPGEVIRISRRGGVSPTADIDREVRRMTGASKVASRGGIALSVVGLGIACHEIAHTESRDHQNDILVESGGSLIGGLAFGLGAGIGLALMATPVGWVGALAIGAGGALTGYAGGRASIAIYDLTGRKIDFVERLGVSQVCAPGRAATSSTTPRPSYVWTNFRR